MYQTNQMEPILFRVPFTNSFRSLKGMNNVGNIHIGIAFVNEIVQQIQCIQDAELGMIKFQPFFMLNSNILFYSLPAN